MPGVIPRWQFHSQLTASVEVHLSLMWLPLLQISMKMKATEMCYAFKCQPDLLAASGLWGRSRAPWTHSSFASFASEWGTHSLKWIEDIHRQAHCFSIYHQQIGNEWTSNTSLLYTLDVFSPSPQSQAGLHDDVVDAAHSSQPFPHRLADADVRHVAGQLADAGEHRWLQGHERLVWQGLNLVENGQHHVGPCLGAKWIQKTL